MQKTYIILLCAGLLAIMTGCSKVINTETSHDYNTDFASFRTFAFLDQSGRSTRLDDPFMQAPEAREAVKDVIAEELTHRRFEQGSMDGADFVIAVFGGTNDFMKQEMKRWQYAYGDSWRRIDNKVYPQGTLIIDFFTRSGSVLIWRGTAPGIVGDNGEFTGNMKKAVSELIKAYPPEMKLEDYMIN